MPVTSLSLILIPQTFRAIAFSMALHTSSHLFSDRGGLSAMRLLFLGRS